MQRPAAIGRCAGWVTQTFCGRLCDGPTPVGEAIGRCEELLDSARDDRVLEAVVKRFLAELYAMAGRSEEALELVRESSRVLDELDHHQTLECTGRMPRRPRSSPATAPAPSRS